MAANNTIRERFSKNERYGRAGLTRRRLLQTGALGSAAMLAGCLGEDDPDVSDGDDDDGTDGETPDGVHVDGQDLYLTVDHNPDETHFAYFIRDGTLESRYTVDWFVYPAMHDPGMWGRFYHSTYWPSPGEVFPGIYESWEIEWDTITVTIRDDAYWSDGVPITARDAIGNQALWTEPGPRGDFQPLPEETRPHGGAAWDYSAPDGMDGKVFQFHVTPLPEWEEFGGFTGYQEGEILYRMGCTWNSEVTRLGVSFPTHIDRYSDFFDEVIEYWDEKDPNKPSRVGHAEQYFDADILEYARDPENVVTSGAWTLDEIVGTTEFVLKPNEYHRHADEVNFDRVILEYSEDDIRTEASLHTGRLDYAYLAEAAPPETTDSFPDIYTEVTSASGAGYVLGVDHSTKFGDVRVRQAMMYALYKPDIAQNIHPNATTPITIPGWHTWAADAVLDEEWALANLIDYTQDLDRAAELMIEAGYERGPNDVWEKDGEPLQATIATVSESAAFESTVASQLGDFGMEIGYQVYDQALFEERRVGSEQLESIEEEYGGRGDLEIWANDGPSRATAGYYNGMGTFLWNSQARTDRVRAHNFFDHEAQEATLPEYNESGWVEGQYPLWKEWTVDLPPLGDPDGPREPFNPAYTRGTVSSGPDDFDSPQDHNPYYNPPHDEPHPENADYFWQMLAWTLNWWLPVMPVVQAESQHFINTANWHWPTDHYMWEYIGMQWFGSDLIGMNRVSANVDDPKDGAEVVDR